MKTIFGFACLCMMALTLLSCEKVVMDVQQDDILENSADEGVTVRLKVVELENEMVVNTTRSLEDVSDVCTRLNFVVFKNGTKVKGISQQVGEESFGTVNMTLQTGTYQLMVLAHSGKANPTLSNPEKVQFSNTDTGYSDTFYYYGDLTVNEADEEGQVQSYEVKLSRAVSMFKLVIYDTVPENVNRFRIWYEGGSGALNTVTGFGCVNSTQYVIYPYTAATATSPLELVAYTFLHADEGELNIIVTAYGANDNIVKSREFTNVPMKRNQITQYAGNFFTGSSGSEDPVTPDNPVNPNNPDASGGFTITVETGWDGQSNYTY